LKYLLKLIVVSLLNAALTLSITENISSVKLTKQLRFYKALLMTSLLS